MFVPPLLLPHPGPQTVPIKDGVPIDARPPPPSAIWSLAPAVRRRRVPVPALFEPLAPAAARTRGRSESPAVALVASMKTSTATSFTSKAATTRSLSPAQQLVEASRSSSPFIDGLWILDAHPCRTDKVRHLLSPALAAFLEDPAFQYSCTSLGGHAAPGRVDWRAIYPWVVDVLGAANSQACLEPELEIGDDSYASIVKRFDKTTGSWMCNAPLSENILPFAQFVVAVLYLEAQEEARKRTEREQQIRELLQSECAQEGNPGDPGLALLWDTDDVLELRVVLPDGLGEVSTSGGCVDCGEGTDLAEESCGVDPLQPVKSILWADFDPQATGPDAARSAPPGQYQVQVVLAERRSGKPCHWACQVSVDGKLSVFGGTWGNTDMQDVAAFSKSEPASG
ncbi:unnamed protein product [Prorocentrum cordatum]|uniref:Uncharacterized protein n=1 Tax=Prorocentrum cordatum TaxID=2364126 RepID=A0ABN9RBD0_9DINO|nr:unnamed protein product [Polarella glacialis]